MEPSNRMLEIWKPEVIQRLKRYLRYMIISLLFVTLFVSCWCFLCRYYDVYDFSMKEMYIFPGIALAIVLLEFITLTMVVLLNLRPLPKLPGGPWVDKQLLVCSCCEPIYCIMGLFCMGITLVFLYGAIYSISHWDGTSNTVGLICVFLFSALGFGAMGAVLFLAMKNCMLIFYPGGLYYQNILGKPYEATNEQVEYAYCINYRTSYFVLGLPDKKIYINSCCGNYFTAEGYVIKNFPKYEIYLKNKEEKS